MRRGRPAMRDEFRREILSALGDCEYGVTVAAVKRMVDARRPRRCGWDTVLKYLEELAAERLVLRQTLPTHRGHKPLVVYAGRRGPDR